MAQTYVCSYDIAPDHLTKVNNNAAGHVGQTGVFQNRGTNALLLGSTAGTPASNFKWTETHSVLRVEPGQVVTLPLCGPTESMQLYASTLTGYSTLTVVSVHENEGN